VVLSYQRLPLAAISHQEHDVASTLTTTPPVSAPPRTRAVAIDPDEERAREFLSSRHTGLSAFEEERLAQTIVEEARAHGLDLEMVLAVIHVESGGYHMAVSAVGALGLMQLLPATAEEQAEILGLDWRGPDSLFDPVLNVKLGVAYLKTLYVRFGSVSTALAAYNWGPGRIDRRLRRGKSVPKIYVEKVMNVFDTSTQRS
jgi:soluble lytic murein transglycosylase-like protein